FEIDTPNSTRQAHSPSPLDSDEHVDADNGRQTLSWTAAVTAISHNLYFGTSLSAVTAATPAAPEFKGNQTATTFAVSSLNSALTYYWRVDEVDLLGNVTRGTVWYFRPRHLAFPGAEGYGRFARGGRGGRVVEITSLADYAPGDTPVPGTLRYAIEQETGPRTIVFAVSGLITLESRLTINSPYLTIAGQTAPGKGICLREWTMGLSGAQDVIIRDVRSRPGNISGTTIDGMGMSGSNHCILDHCSVSWSIDEAFSSRTAQNITLQRTLISEALNIAGHQNYPPGTMHGYAASIGGDIGSFHHNLLAHCYGRNWSLAGGLDSNGYFSGRLDLTDNVVYNWGHRATDGGAMEVNFVNNYYKPGAATDFFYALNAQYDNFPGTQRYYFAGNVMPGHFDETNEAAGRTATASTGSSLPTYQNFVDAPFFASFVTTQPARLAYKYVLSDVGCNQPALDDHDVRVIRETRDGTFTYRGSVSGLAGMPDTQADVGGWETYPGLSRAADWDSDHDGLPDWWERLIGTNPNSPAGDFSDANADPDGDGYTYLEDYLNWMAAPHYDCSAGGSVDIDLRGLATGFTASPQFAVSGAVGGAVYLLADGTTARFTSTDSASRLGKFLFTVTDGEGDSLTREIGIHVISSAAGGSSTLTALSVRSVSQSRSNPLIVGFSVSGTQRVLLRGVGPGLAGFAVANFLPDPMLELYHRVGSTDTMIASNDDWGSGDVTTMQSAFTAAGTFGLDRTSKDAALLTTITGVNSAFAYDTAGRNGVVLVELYDAGSDGASRLVGVSARNFVGTGENVLIAGFVISGNAPKKLLIRGVGPTLASFSVTGALADPRLDVYNSTNQLLAGNDDWTSGGVAALRSAFTAASDFDLPDSSKDAAMVIYLAPGLYSAVVSGVGGLTGQALVEIYELP
ncbi:MAG TPA: hypothetical protein VMC06_12830, partial [Opitutaceae bacterium]|nr:hypothetical protein [Opitutaceae bacterium]